MTHALTPETAARFARIALGHVTREYPHKLDHVMDGPEDVLGPRELHPIFFGSFDWHSCVHGWWLMLRLRRLFPELPAARRIEALADAMLAPDKVAGEPRSLFTPAFVSDRSDGKIAHLDGVNLSRAWCWRGLADGLEPTLAALAQEAADVHLAASLPHVAGDYMGEHWLATFALLALDAGSTG